MRGAQFIPYSFEFGLGIIPADAGSTDLDSLDSMVNKDHPRGCGEHGVGPSAYRL